MFGLDFKFGFYLMINEDSGGVEDRTLLKESWCSSREGTRAGERDRDRDKDRETQRDRQTHRDRHTERH